MFSPPVLWNGLFRAKLGIKKERSFLARFSWFSLFPCDYHESHGNLKNKKRSITVANVTRSIRFIVFILSGDSTFDLIWFWLNFDFHLWSNISIYFNDFFNTQFEKLLEKKRASLPFLLPSCSARLFAVQSKSVKASKNNDYNLSGI